MATINKSTMSALDFMNGKVALCVAAEPTEILEHIGQVESVDPAAYDASSDLVTEVKTKTLDTLQKLLDQSEERENQAAVIAELQQAMKDGAKPVVQFEDRNNKKARSRVERENIAAHRKHIAEQMKDLVKVKFQNLEDPSMDVPFSFEGFDFHLKPGQVQELPKIVVKHLNRIKYPQYTLQDDGATGQAKMVRQDSNRFVCVLVDDEYN